MSCLPRICVLVLGVLLTLAWSSSAVAQSRNKGGRGGHAGSVSKKAESKKDDESPRKKQHKTQNATPAHQPTRAPAYQPPRTQQPGPTRAQPASPPAYRLPPAHTAGPPTTVSGRTARGHDRLAANRLGAPISRIPAVPPVVKRGGKTFTQTAAASGGRVVVTRKSTPSAATNSPYSHGEAASGHHDGHNGGHHGATAHDHHYHYHYWGHGYYYCYLSYWPYDPWFWGFYYAPFHAPWDYHWWWAGSSWYRTWGWYYVPYVVYVAPSYWVTDYTLARMLEAEYERGWADGQAAAGTAISEPVKEQVRLQVDDVARTFQASEALLLETALADPEYLFIVDTQLSVATAGGGTCALTGGDIIRRAPGPEAALPVASMTVVTSKSEGCTAGDLVSVSYSDLQEMLNTFGQTVDDGLNELQRQQQEEADGDR